MDFGLSDDQRDIQRTARDLLAERARPERVRECAEAGRTDAELWRELCELGWPGIAVAERYGGQGLGTIELAILCEELGRTVAPVPYLPNVLAATLIEHAGSEDLCERWLPGLASGELIGAVGTADFVVGGANADVIVLLDGSGGALAVAADGSSVTTLDTIDPTRDAASVAAAGGEALTGDVAASVDRALVAVAAELVGVCDRALAMTVAYVKDRRQFGVPVGSFQAVSHRCAQMLLDTERARSTTAFAAWTADADAERLAEAAAMAKAVASDAGREVTASAIQAHGGIGFTWEADVHWLYKRAQIDATLLGGAGSQRSRLAGILAERPGAAAAV
ncbi:MAG TPA: acyl-CoA dehydrogenase family protein [Solirubrobacteraceae bacterium]|nr:acyl-CoA dehydrogenase family protein [Solirubrobacteraceae bacterium]